MIEKMRSGGPGYKLALLCMAGITSGSVYFGRNLENESYRCGLAGITATLSVEVATHALSTIDVNAKTTHNFSIVNYFKNHGYSGLLKGFQPMVYGYVVSGFLYYSMYKATKESIKKFIRKYHGNDKSLQSIALMSAGASAVCEVVCL